MIGTYGTSAYSEVKDFNNHRDYLSFMYDGAKGFVARAVINGGYFRQFLFTSDWLINRNRYYGVKDVYISLNTFCKRERTVDQLKRLNALYLDIDCYKLGLTQEQVLCELEADYFGQSLPYPTFVINSGRGLYLIWKIDEDRNALPRWTSVQRYLFEVCKHLNADALALDAARIFRVPFSVNSKNDGSVSIMRFYDVKYTLYEIIKEHNIQPYVPVAKKAPAKYPYGVATENQRRCAIIISEKYGLELPDFNSYEETFNFISANYEKPKNDAKILFFNSSNHKPFLSGRCQDIMRLFAIRSGEDCRRREVALFLYRLWLCETTGNYDCALRETLLLNESFDRPLPEKYVIDKTASAEKKVKAGETYKYGKQKLVEILDITPEEMCHMKYLYMCPEILKERIRAKNRRAYLKRLELEGKLTKKEALLRRRIEIKTMLDKGMKKDLICETLGISLKTFNRDKIVIAAENIKGRVIEAAKVVKDTVTTAIIQRWTKFQPSYYVRTCEASSAFSLLEGGFHGWGQFFLQSTLADSFSVLVFDSS